MFTQLFCYRSGRGTLAAYEDLVNRFFGVVGPEDVARLSEGRCLQQMSSHVISDHLIYAYCVENTRVYEIFRRVLKEFLHGESLGAPSKETQQWIHTTEQLFYRDCSPLVDYSITSYVRPDPGATRRNAYYRMFAMDLNHGADGNQPYNYQKPEAANRTFAPIFEDFLREVWVAYTHRKNQTGKTETDENAIANLARKLQDMLRARREQDNLNLSREEFFAVATMSWLHVTLSYNAPVVKDLRAFGESPAQRLQKIGEMVKLPASGKSDSFFRLANPMSRILREIETGVYSTVAGVPQLYTDTGAATADMMEIITQWSIATGRDMKQRKAVAPAK